MADPAPKSTWNDAFVEEMFKHIKTFISTKKEKTGPFDWVPAEFFGVDISATDAALMSTQIRNELDEKGDQIDDLDVRQFLDETLGVWVDAYTGRYNQLPSDSVITDARNVIESLMWDRKGTVNFNGDIITYPNIVNYRKGVVGLGEITPFQDIHTIFDRQFISAERRPLYLHDGDKLNAYLDALENAGVLDSKTRFDRNITEPIRQQFFAEGGIYDHISQRAGLNPALTAVATKYINWGLGTGTDETQKEFGYLTTHASPNPLTRTEYADQFDAEQLEEDVKLEDYPKVTGGTDTLRTWMEGTTFRRFPPPSSGDASYDQYEQWITDAAYDMEKYIDSLLAKRNPNGSITYTEEDIIRLATNYTNKLWPSRPDVKGIDAEAAAEVAEAAATAEAKTAKTARDTAVKLYNTKLKALGYVNNVFLPRLSAEQGISIDISQAQKDEIAIKIFSAHDEAFRDDDLPVPDIQALVAPYVDIVTDVWGPAEALKKTQDTYTTMKTGTNFTTAAEEAVKTILDDVGAVIPDYAKNAVANILKRSYEEHKQAGLPAPNDVEVLSPYKAQMENWVAQGKVDTSDIAEGILGITRFTPSDITTDLEGATADLTEFIDGYLENNPLTPFTRTQIGDRFMDQYAVTPEGNLVPSAIDRTSTYTGRMLDHPLGRLQLGLDPVTQWDPATETWTTVEDRWGGLPDTPFSDAFGFPTAPEGTQPFDVDRFIESAQLPQRSEADKFMDAFETWRTGRPATDVRQEQLGFPFPHIPDMSMEWVQGYGAPVYDPETKELISGVPAYDFRTFSRELDEQFSRGYLKKYVGTGKDKKLVPWTAQDVEDAKAAQLQSEAGDPSYGSYPQPTEAQMRAPFEEMFGGTTAGREFIGRKLSDPDFFTGLSTQLGALSSQEGLRHPQTIPADPMSLVSAFPATKAESLGAEFQQEQQEQQVRRGELGGMGSTIFKRRTL